MTQVLERAGSTPMSREKRGKAIEQRMTDLGLDVAKLARGAGKSRNTLDRAFEGGSSDKTYKILEDYLDQYEANSGVGFTAKPERKPASIRMEEGGTLVVEGPLETPEDAELLKNLYRDVVREWRAANREAPTQ